MHTFNCKPEEPTFFALCYPFSYQDCLQKFSDLETKFKDSTTVYFNRETAVHSAEGRAMELITVSSRDGITSEREGLIPDLFPDGPDHRPYRYFLT